jgi:hypothetical protein
LKGIADNKLELISNESDVLLIVDRANPSVPVTVTA